VVKRVSTDPADEDYITVPAHGGVYIDVDLSKSYGIVAKGKYMIRASTLEKTSFSNTLIIETTTGDAHLPKEYVPEISKDDDIDNMVNCGVVNSIRVCNSQQVTDSRTAYRMASQVIPSLPVYRSDNPGDSNSNRWFGLGGTGLSAVRGGYQNIQRALCKQSGFTGGSQVECDYGCTFYAYVFPSDRTYTVYTCPAAHRAPMTGRDSQVGIMVHELAHFTAIYGTRDHQYGCRGCQDLARTNPSRARINSDSLEYCVEFSGYFGNPTC